jgi:hypothetical protein
MELELVRTYADAGTNGDLYLKLCHTIELPWRGNQRNISCVSEGRYELVRRYTARHGLHLMLADVPGRQGILLHPANDAATELRGCIAPVTALTAPGKGTQSRIANDAVKRFVFAALDENEKVFITIKSNEL